MSESNKQDGRKADELEVARTLLARAEKMAALGQLLAGVAHEINTPLGALKSNNDLAIRTRTKIKEILTGPDMPSEVREHPKLLQMIIALEGLDGVNETALDRIVGIVNSLRTFARKDTDELVDVDIHEGIDSTLTLVHHKLKNRIAVHKDFGDLPLITCHPNQLNQVTLNILVNAAQAIEGEGDIYIKTEHRGGKVIIEVRDTGTGISAENLPRIFEPGFTTKGAGVGTGLGLSIVRTIVEEHHGKIEIESEVGKGTTIRVILPVAQ